MPNKNRRKNRESVPRATANRNRQPTKNEQSPDALSDSFCKVRTSAPKSRLESNFKPAFLILSGAFESHKQRRYRTAETVKI